MGSFDRSLAFSKLMYVEKYKRATPDELKLIMKELEADVVLSEDGTKATINCMNSRTVVNVI